MLKVMGVVIVAIVVISIISCTIREPIESFSCVLYNYSVYKTTTPQTENPYDVYITVGDSTLTGQLTIERRVASITEARAAFRDAIEQYNRTRSPKLPPIRMLDLHPPKSSQDRPKP